MGHCGKRGREDILTRSVAKVEPWRGSLFVCLFPVVVLNLDVSWGVSARAFGWQSLVSLFAARA